VGDEPIEFGILTTYGAQLRTSTRPETNGWEANDTLSWGRDGDDEDEDQQKGWNPHHEGFEPPRRRVRTPPQTTTTNGGVGTPATTTVTAPLGQCRLEDNRAEPAGSARLFFFSYLFELVRKLYYM